MSLPTKGNFSMESTYNVYDDHNGVRMQVRSFPDAPDSAMELHTGGAESEQFYGKNSLVLDAPQARLLAQALIRKADDMEQHESE